MHFHVPGLYLASLVPFTPEAREDEDVTWVQFGRIGVGVGE